MEVEEFIILQNIKASGSAFLNSLKIGDKVIVDLDNDVYREAIIESEPYAAPSGAAYININVFDKVLSTNQLYAVPIWDLHPLDSKKIIYKAYVYSLSYRGIYFSGRSSYELVYKGKTIKRADSCLGRKDANKRLIDEDILKDYNINQVYSNGNLIYNKD